MRERERERVIVAGLADPSSFFRADCHGHISGQILTGTFDSKFQY
jgi:hypothetical protein